MKHSPPPWDTFAQAVFSLFSLQASESGRIETACANAQLISAAPDLLSACLELRRLGTSTEASEAAIAKALGVP